MGMPVASMCKILSHTQRVHNQSYQTGRMRQDLAATAFRDFAGEAPEPLKNRMRKAFDPKAPIYLTAAQMAELMSRNNTTALAQRLVELQTNGYTKEA